MNAEELFLTEKNQIRFIEAFGDWKQEPFAVEKFNKDIAKTKNYKENYFYHATGGLGESGVGKGLYLGKDKLALDNLYNLNGTEGEIISYFGTPIFIDLTDDVAFDTFWNEAKSKFQTDDFLEKYTLLKGYDGIRYYDVETTGEEFVLYNIEKVQVVEK